MIFHLQMTMAITFFCNKYTNTYDLLLAQETFVGRAAVIFFYSLMFSKQNVWQNIFQRTGSLILSFLCLFKFKLQ